LEDVILLKTDEAQEWGSLAQQNATIRACYNQHMHFIDTLKENQSIFQRVLRTLRPPFASLLPDVATETMLHPLNPFDTISLPKAVDIELGRLYNVAEAKLNPASRGMASTREKVESHDTSLVSSFIKGVHELHREVQTVWESFQNRSISASASGMITALCYHLTETEVARFEITEQLASVEIRGVSVPDMLGVLFNLFEEMKEQATKMGHDSPAQRAKSTRTPRSSSYRHLAGTSRCGWTKARQ
jgi:hypothetical protein